MTDQPTRLWGGRFADEPSPAMMAFTESLSFDVALAEDDARVLGAHARALARAGLLTFEEADAIAVEAGQIAAEIAAGSFAFQASDEDIHTAIERALIDRLPDAGPKSRAGLSRNDRVAAAFRRWSVRAVRALAVATCDLASAVVARAEETTDVLLPGYTHLQRAQPVRLAHHLLAHVHALARDAERLCDAADRANVSPLGSGALAGTTFGLDAERTAEDLGFAGAMGNSIDAVSSRDFAAEIAAACAILGIHCSRIGEEIVLWTTAEFGFATLSDAWATGSSLMPQKKNPDIAELARGKAGRLIGNLTGLLATLKGLPLAYNRDLQEDKEPLLDSVEQLARMLPALRGVLETITFNAEAMARAASDGALLATDLADYLVVRGVAFRDAHGIVGRLIEHASVERRELTSFTTDELRSFSPAFSDDVAQALDANASVERRSSPGPAKASIEKQLQEMTRTIEGLRARAGG